MASMLKVVVQRRLTRAELVPFFETRAEFNAAAAALFVPKRELAASVDVLKTDELQHRVPESGHAAAHRAPPAPVLPAWAWASGRSPAH